MKANELVSCIIEQNPEGGNKILEKYLKKSAANEAEMTTGLMRVIRNAPAPVLRDFILMLPAPAHSNCGGSCCGNIPFAADGESNAPGRPINPALAHLTGEKDFLEKHGSMVFLSIAAVAIVYIISKS